MKLLVLPGDGIGPEIVTSATEVLEALDARFNLRLDLIQRDIGFSSLEKHGTPLKSVWFSYLFDEQHENI